MKMNNHNKIWAIVMLVAAILFLVAYFITGKYLATSLVCWIAFVGFKTGNKKY